MTNSKSSSKETRSRRAAGNKQITDSVKNLYDDVVNEPVPDQMLSAIPKDDTPEGQAS